MCDHLRFVFATSPRISSKEFHNTIRSVGRWELVVTWSLDAFFGFKDPRCTRAKRCFSFMGMSSMSSMSSMSRSSTQPWPNLSDLDPAGVLRKPLAAVSAARSKKISMRLERYRIASEEPVSCDPFPSSAALTCFDHAR